METFDFVFYFCGCKSIWATSTNDAEHDERMMTTQLRELEDDGLVHRGLLKSLRDIYTLTEKGESLRPLFGELSKWGN